MQGSQHSPLKQPELRRSRITKEILAYLIACGIAGLVITSLLVFQSNSHGLLPSGFGGVLVFPGYIIAMFVPSVWGSLFVLIGVDAVLWGSPLFVVWKLWQFRKVK